MRTLIIYLLLAWLQSLWLPIIGQSTVPPSAVSQVDIVALLSGAQSIGQGPALTARTTSRERRIARRYMKLWMEELGLEAIEQNYRWPNLHPALDIILSPYQGTNLYCILPGNESAHEFVVLGAHYDSKLACPGAIDNATGVALAFGVLQQLCLLKERQKHLMLVLFDQEEEELVGSQAFVRLLQKENFPIHSVHTFDMVGWDADGNGEVELGDPSPRLQAIYEAHAQEMDIPTYVTTGGSTDCQSFLKNAYEVIGINEAYAKGDSTPYKDTPADTFDTVNFQYLTQVTQYVTRVISSIIQQ